MTHGNIGAWKVSTGGKISPGDVLLEVETDKALMDFECQERGFLAAQLVPTGTKNFPVGEPVAVLVESAKDVPAFSDFKAEKEVSKQEEASEPKIEEQPAAKQATGGPAKRDHLVASPLARKTARESGVELEGVQGSGPGGRIVRADVVGAGSHSAREFIEIPVDTIRGTIAKRLTESYQRIPHFSLVRQVDVTRLVAFRASISPERKPSLNDFIVKAAGSALLCVPQVNSQWAESSIRQFSSADISIAIATADGNLFTPIVKSVERKSVLEISRAIRSFAERAKEKKLRPEEMAGGTFTVSNLGMFGVDRFNAIINPPQSAILAVGCSRRDPADASRHSLAVTLTCDHRVVDGAVGARWLQHFARVMEEPLELLLEK